MKKTLFMIYFLSTLSFQCSSDLKNEGKTVASQTEIIESVVDSLAYGIHKVKEDDFGDVINLKGEPREIKPITNISQLIIKDDILIIRNAREDSLFMFFSLPNFELLAAFGISGQGPEEHTFPLLVETNESDKLCYIYNQLSERLWSVSRQFEPALVNNHQLPKTSRSYGDKQIAVLSNGDRFFAESSGNKKSVNLQRADSSDSELVYDLSNEVERHQNWAAYIGDFGTNEGLGRVVYAYKYFKSLSFVDLKNYKFKNLIFDSDKQSEGKTAVDFLAPSTVTHYWGMSVTTKGIYCGYSGRTPIQVQEDNNNGNSYIYIEKYDWQGNQVKKYKLDNWGYFCVDEKRNTLYIASTVTTPSIMVYTLNP